MQGIDLLHPSHDQRVIVCLTRMTRLQEQVDQLRREMLMNGERKRKLELEFETVKKRFKTAPVNPPNVHNQTSKAYTPSIDPHNTSTDNIQLPKHPSNVHRLESPDIVTPISIQHPTVSSVYIPQEMEMHHTSIEMTSGDLLDDTEARTWLWFYDNIIKPRRVREIFQHTEKVLNVKEFGITVRKHSQIPNWADPSFLRKIYFWYTKTLTTPLPFKVCSIEGDDHSIILKLKRPDVHWQYHLWGVLLPVRTDVRVHHRCTLPKGGHAVLAGPISCAQFQSAGEFDCHLSYDLPNESVNGQIVGSQLIYVYLCEDLVYRRVGSEVDISSPPWLSVVYG
ncbi:hypothetical protein PROFUN_09515 [Planoprotostelium fungivorum]|uniref:Uncharacterized protein n=1 Tax=Planoprotostelium fungivorum TaxID=1890364 RepID=A0A2P6N8B4_9EUKA|nr:hypothetical protein PROFUN_12146 [Planoprotostelium fungivorum]PRP83303.1 hypothetical protein PROFUN_09515 [Planoprotostelium fungivorum]